MSEATGEAGQPGPNPEIDPDWFKQIKFDSRRGLDSVLPIEIPVVPDDLGDRHQH